MPSWATVWTAIGAVAAVLAVAIPLYHLYQRRTQRRYRMFLSMQMSRLPDGEYERVREQVMDAIYEIRKEDDVYFFNEFLPDRSKFDERAFDAHEYLGEIRKADYFVAVLSESILSSIYFEAGLAVALGKQSFYFIVNSSSMPLVMRRAVIDHPKIKVIELDSVEELGIRLRHLMANARRYS